MFLLIEFSSISKGDYEIEGTVVDSLINDPDWVENQLNPTPTPVKLLTRLGEVPDNYYIKTLSNCDEDTARGHILFISSEDEEHMDLWVMDGNGCDAHLVFKDITSSADWSIDGQKIAVGCKDEEFGYAVCVLDAPETLKSCLGGAGGVECKPVLLDKISVPEKYESKSVQNVSWFNDGKRILVSINDKQIILSLEEPQNWQMIIEGFRYEVDVSPISDEIMIGGLWKVAFQGSILTKYMFGNVPEWSPDGEKVAFLYYEEDHPYYWAEEYTGIMQMSFTGNKVVYSVLYRPRPYGVGTYNYKMIDNYNFFFSTQNTRYFSWSPDSKYLVFSAKVERESEFMELFRMNTYTGDIVKLDPFQGDLNSNVYGPAWGVIEMEGEEIDELSE